MATEETENVPMKAAPRRRWRMDIYDVRHLVRVIITAGAGGAVIWGAILGDIWLWRLLYG